jgi:internalin A
MALDLIRKAKAERWKRLDLGRTGIIGAVPDEVGELEDLEELILSNDYVDRETRIWKDSFNTGSLNKISSLPANLPAGLLALQARWTEISDVSPVEHQLKLLYLDLSFTRVVDISPLRLLLQLQYLDLGYTIVTNISPLKELLQLKRLYLPKTHVVDISPLKGLKQLTTVDLTESYVIDLSPLKDLIESGLNTDFDAPDRIPILQQVRVLANPPIWIAENGREAILNYWKEQDRVGILPAKELKLFLLGNTTAGKSTLAHALIHNEYLANSNSTEGANLSQKWQLGDVTVNIWDFGGQEYFHATHRLLMNDPHFNQSGYHKTPIRYSDEETAIEEDLEHFPHGYWLETIRDHAKRSSAMVLWNKLDGGNSPQFGLSDADRALFGDRLESYPISLKAAFEDHLSQWENKWKVFSDDLRQQIGDALKDRQVIQYWPSVREAVEERSKSAIRISWEEFEVLCKADDPLRELGNIVIYLRDMCGAILYFESNPVLNRTVFINPNRINELIYAVLNRQVKEAGGRFTFAHARGRVHAALAQVHDTGVEAADAEAFTNELIAVMESFEIISKVRQDGDVYVSPQYLPRVEPGDLQEILRYAKLENGFQIRFKTFIPRHIIPCFIAQKGLFAKEEMFWKFGILYEESASATALVKVDYASRVIVVSIHDPVRHRLDLQGIFEALKGLIRNDKAFEVSFDGVVWVDFEKLMEAVENNASFVKTIDGERIGIEPFRLFSSKRSQAHNIGNIIKLLTEAFTAIEFERFALVHFEVVHRQFTPGMLQSQRVLLLANYAKKHGRLDDLLEVVRGENSFQYDLCGPYFG